MGRFFELMGQAISINLMILGEFWFVWLVVFFVIITFLFILSLMKI